MKGPGGIAVDAENDGPGAMLDIQAGLAGGAPYIAVIVRDTDGKGGQGPIVGEWRFVDDDEAGWLLDLMIEAYGEYHALAEYERIKTVVEDHAKTA